MTYATPFVAPMTTPAARRAAPADALGGVLFSGHMVQHVLLMMAAAPLLALGAPAHVWLWALPLATLWGGPLRPHGL